MTNDKTKKNGIRRLKGVRSNQNQSERDVKEQQIADTEVMYEETETSNEPEQQKVQTNNDLFSKSDQDLILSVENILKDREIIQYKSQGLLNYIQSLKKSLSEIKVLLGDIKNNPYQS
ncbi:hypothetical protein ACTWP4_10650 [Gracilibacillus sp. D59]|uniref:hypothetical protein n=1 Tax=Gracilibacillus sp. D59 TaxID=3457434 RepID=UPI003FCCF464